MWVFPFLVWSIGSAINGALAVTLLAHDGDITGAAICVGASIFMGLIAIAIAIVGLRR